MILHWGSRVHPPLVSGEYTSTYFTASMHSLFEHAVADLQALEEEGCSLASVSTAVFESLHVVTRIIAQSHTGQSGALANQMDAWTKLVEAHASTRWAKISHGDVLTGNLQASAKRREEARRLLPVYVAAVQTAKAELVRCCGQAWKVGLASQMESDDDGAYTRTDLDTPCAARSVCSWPTGIDACDAWSASGPPKVGIRCMKATRTTPARVVAAAAADVARAATDAAAPGPMQGPTNDRAEGDFEIVPDELMEGEHSEEHGLGSEREEGADEDWLEEEM